MNLNVNKMHKKISVIVPAYNEEKTISDCLQSLMRQSYKNLEIIVVDDGSFDKTMDILKNIKNKDEGKILTLMSQVHKGPGLARNLGAKKASGYILVFADSDMVFDKDFIGDLVGPILEGETIGTFSKNEMNRNLDNVWSRCWNINRNWSIDRLIPLDSPDISNVFRAILKKEFEKVGGFSSSGEYTDDWSLAQKLNIKATIAPGALYYHTNPVEPGEIWTQAQWFATNKFISGSFLRKLKSLIFYSFPFSVAVGIFKSSKHKTWQFLPFKIFFDLSVFVAIFRSFISSQKSK